MIKTSFTVCYRINQQTHIVLGVTSIVPNLNGYLMFTEDGRNHFIESHELMQGTLAMNYFSYEYTDELNPEAIVHDHRTEVAK